MRVDLVRRDFPLPLHQERDAKGALVHLPLFPTQRLVGRGQLAGWSAIVTEEEHERILLQTRVPKLLHDGTNTVVHVCQHGRKNSAMKVLNVGELLHVGIRTLQRTMHGVVSQVKQERFVVVSPDIIDRFTRQRVGQIFRFHHRLPTTHDRIVGVVVRFVISHMRRVDQATFSDPTALAPTGQGLSPKHRRHTPVRRRYEIMSLVGETEKLIKPVSKRVKSRRSPLMPFADQARCVARGLEGFRDRGFLDRQAETRIFVLGSGRIEFVPKTRGRPTREQPSPRRTAIRCGHVASREANPIRGDGVDVRCRDICVALAAELTISEVVCK